MRYLLFALIFLATAAQAQMPIGSKSSWDQPAATPDKGVRQVAPNELVGHCSFVVPRGMMATVCMEVMVALLDEKGNALLQTRTDQQGNFSFPVEPGKAYLLGSGSTHYEVVTPIATVSGGKAIELKLRHK